MTSVTRSQTASSGELHDDGFIYYDAEGEDLDSHQIKGPLEIYYDAPVMKRYVKSYVNIMPDPVLHILFGHLDPTTLQTVGGVDPRWKNASKNEDVQKRAWSRYDPSLDFNVEVIDEKVWRRIFDDATLARHGLSFDDADPLDGRALCTYLRRFGYNKIEGTGDQTGLAFITIPKGLTFNKLLALAKEPKEGGHVAKFRLVAESPLFWNDVTRDLGDVKVQKTYRVVISKNVIYGSKGQTYDIQKQQAEEMGGELPGVLEATLLPVLKFMSAPIGSRPIRLFNNAPWTYTHCKEIINDWPLVVGGFAPAGLYVHSCFEHDALGVGCIRKF